VEVRVVELIFSGQGCTADGLAAEDIFSALAVEGFPTRHIEGHPADDHGGAVSLVPDRVVEFLLGTRNNRAVLETDGVSRVLPHPYVDEAALGPAWYNIVPATTGQHPHRMRQGGQILAAHLDDDVPIANRRVQIVALELMQPLGVGRNPLWC